VPAAVLIAAVVLSGATAAGCSHPSAPARGSVGACTQFGIEAIRHHVTVASLPPACHGLTRSQVNFAVGSALHSAAAGAGGKASQRERIAKASHFLQRLVTVVPEQRRPPPASVPAAHQAGRPVLGLIAACTWLLTAGLGLRMMARWIGGGRRRRAPAGRPRRLPALNVAHLGLATAGLLTWIAYLATGATGVAWAACTLLLPVAALGMTLVFLSPSRSPGESTTSSQAASDGTMAVRAGDDPPRARRSPVLVVSAHVAFAVATILFAFLTATGNG